MIKRLHMTGKEFLEKILSGERDFSRISLENQDLAQDEAYQEVIEQLQARGQKRAKKEPLLFRKSKLKKVKAPKFYAPYADFYLADLSYGNFIGSYFKEANFPEAKLIQTNLFSANLKGADFFKADLYHAILQGADIKAARFSRADLSKTDLRNVQNLSYARDLPWAIFNHTLLSSEKEEAIIEDLRQKATYFEIRFK